MKPLLSIENAGFAYDGKSAVEGLHFSLRPGDYLCIVGENGSGKSTLVDGIVGLKQPCEGTIVYHDDLKRTQIGYLPQQRLIQGTFPASVREVVLSGRLGHKGASPFYTKLDRSLAREALEHVGASKLERAWFGGLSGGQRQRVLLARALVSAPDGLKVLILDEPMSGLDPHVRTDIYELIGTLNTELHLAIVMVTHDTNTALHYANKVLYLATRQLFFGTPEQFEQSDVGHTYLRDACGSNCAICGFSHLSKEQSSHA